MSTIRKIILILTLFISNTSLFAQKETEQIAQNLQTANFSNLLLFWNSEVELTILEQSNQKLSSPQEANQQLQSFFDQQFYLKYS
jgi:hypothetical protein